MEDFKYILRIRTVSVWKLVKKAKTRALTIDTPIHRSILGQKTLVITRFPFVQIVFTFGFVLTFLFRAYISAFVVAVDIGLNKRRYVP